MSATTIGARSSSAGERSWLSRWWLALCGVTVIVASDWELRARPPDEALAGGVDLAIVLELGLYGLVALYLAANHLPRPRIRRTTAPVYWAGAFVGLMALSLTYTPYLLFATVRVGQMVVILGFVGAVASRGTRAHLHRFTHAYVLVVCASVLFGLALPPAPLDSDLVGRFSWWAVHPTLSGTITGLATVVVVSHLVAGPPPSGTLRWRTRGYVAALVLCGGGLLASQTRGAILGAALAAAIIVITSRPGRRSIDVVAATIVVGAGAALAAGDAVFGYFTRGEPTEKLSTLNERTVLWEAAIDAVGRAPMFGHGITASQGIFFEETGLGGGHNAAINVVVELGLVGLACWVALVISLIAAARRLRGVGDLVVDRSLILGSIAFLLVDGMFFEGPGAVTNVASTWLLLLVGWCAVLLRGAHTG